MSSGALAGVRVLDAASLFPGPLLAAMLGDLGADVVKAEPPRGDPLRAVGSIRDGQSFVFALAGRNKRSIVVDLDTGEGRELLHRLALVADVMVVNQPTSVLERWGCSYEQLAEVNPGLIMASVRGFGATGPYADDAGNGTLAEAFSGVTHLIGDPDGPPVLPSFPMGDVLGGLCGVQGVLAALYWRDANGGVGQFVDVSLYEALLPLLGPALPAWSGRGVPPKRAGGRIPDAAPRNVYRTADGRFVVLSGTTDGMVARILTLIGADGPEEQARFGHAVDRAAHADELDALVSGWIASRSASDVAHSFRHARVPVSLVNDLAALAADPHVVERASLTTLDQPGLGPILLPTPSPRLSKTPATIRTPAPGIGADTQSVLESWLGT